jgi:hypothetical protein
MNEIRAHSQVIEALSPVDLSSYLRASGWRSGQEVAGGLAKTWLRTIDGGEIDVIVPLDRSLRDFYRRLEETLTALERIEQRPQTQILADIGQVASDVIRWRWVQDSEGDGTIPLDLGQQLIFQIRGQLLAAACSTVEPRQFFPSRKSPKAMEYLNKARLGQSERGSYVVAVHCPVPPALPFDEPVDTIPFERRVTLTLGNALQSLIAAASQALSGDKLNRERLAENGVSANLCESVAAVLGVESFRRSVEVRFSYAPARPVGEGAVKLARFNSDLAPLITEIGTDLRETATRESFELVGFVTDLSRGVADERGTATIQGLVDESLRRVEVEATGYDYQFILTEAHRDRRPVACEGELVKVKGKSFRLMNPRGFHIIKSE